MKLLIIARGCPSERYRLNGIFELQQAQALAAAGHDVAFAAVDLRSLRRRRPLGYSQKKCGDVSVFTLAFPLGAVPKKLFDIVGSRVLKKLYTHIVKEWGVPELVHSHFLDYTVLAGNLCQREKLPLVATEHLSTLNTEQPSASLQSRARLAYGKADAVVAVSAPFADKLQKVSDKPVTVVQNMVDLSLFSLPVEKSMADKNAIRFVSTGSLIHRKGFDVLVAAFANYRREYPRATLSIYGAGEKREELERLIEHNGCSENVKLCGYADSAELAQAYAQADVFVLASRAETFGVVYAEAMASGLPVIATECGAPESFVLPECGLLVPVNSEQRLLEAMLKMTKDIDSYCAARIAALSRDMFSPERLVRSLNSVYSRVLASR